MEAKAKTDNFEAGGEVIEVRAEGSNVSTHWFCIFCRDWFLSTPVVLVAYDSEGEQLGDVCYLCYDAAEQGMSRLEDEECKDCNIFRAEYLRSLDSLSKYCKVSFPKREEAEKLGYVPQGYSALHFS
jgi:hypothetical protein